MGHHFIKPSTRKLLIVTTVIITLIVAVTSGLIWVAVCGWPPVIIHNSEYRKLIADFKQAQRREQLPDKAGNTCWDFQVQLPDSQTTVQVKGFAFSSVVGITYSDEGVQRKLYEYFDYSHPHVIRMAGTILYVHWTESLLITENFLMAYDMAARREILRRKIDPGDLR